jgi:hypothetical protein
MQQQLEIIRKTRAAFIYLCKNLSMEQMNYIPEGFNNNIIWNFGHIIVTQQGLCYGLAGVPQKVDKSLSAKYKKGTKPEGIVTEAEYLELQALSVSLMDEFEKDYEAGLFSQYSPYMTSLNVELDSIEKATAFNAFHEGLHFGVMLALKNLAKQQFPL